MIASFMKQIIFRGRFRVAWGTVCHQMLLRPSLCVGLFFHGIGPALGEEHRSPFELPSAMTQNGHCPFESSKLLQPCPSQIHCQLVPRIAFCCCIVAPLFRSRKMLEGQLTVLYDPETMTAIAHTHSHAF